MATGVESIAVAPRHLDKGQGHRIANHVIRYHSTSSTCSSTSTGSSPSSPQPLDGCSPSRKVNHAHKSTPYTSTSSSSASPQTTPPAPESPSRHPLTLNAPGVRSPFDLRPGVSAHLPTGGTTALGRRVPVTRVSADIHSVGL